MKNVASYVLNEHTLGFVFSATPDSFEVLAGKPQLGGHDWKNGSVAIGSRDVLRAATLDDFAFYRVSSTGWPALAGKVAAGGA